MKKQVTATIANARQSPPEAQSAAQSALQPSTSLPLPETVVSSLPSLVGMQPRANVAHSAHAGVRGGSGGDDGGAGGGGEGGGDGGDEGGEKGRL